MYKKIINVRTICLDVMNIYLYIHTYIKIKYNDVEINRDKVSRGWNVRLLFIRLALPPPCPLLPRGLPPPPPPTPPLGLARLRGRVVSSSVQCVAYTLHGSVVLVCVYLVMRFINTNVLI